MDDGIPLRSDEEPHLLRELHWRSVLAEQWEPLGVGLVGTDKQRYERLRAAIQNGTRDELLASDPPQWRTWAEFACQERLRHQKA